ncbi:MAG: hypothetical protein Q7S28_03140 [bacterium]|nr:hypothetical protein [bacterium]
MIEPDMTFIQPDLGGERPVMPEQKNRGHWLMWLWGCCHMGIIFAVYYYIGLILALASAPLPSNTPLIMMVTAIFIDLVTLPILLPLFSLIARRKNYDFKNLFFSLMRAYALAIAATLIVNYILVAIFTSIAVREEAKFQREQQERSEQIDRQVSLISFSSEQVKDEAGKIKYLEITPTIKVAYSGTYSIAVEAGHHDIIFNIQLVDRNNSQQLHLAAGENALTYRLLPQNQTSYPNGLPAMPFVRITVTPIDIQEAAALYSYVSFQSSDYENLPLNLPQYKLSDFVPIPKY